VNRLEGHQAAVADDTKPGLDFAKGTEMTSAELREIVYSSEFKQGMVELSSYLASIMQERPIIYLLAKCLWKRGYKFELEDKRRDLFVNDKHLEFKFTHDNTIVNELRSWPNLDKLWAAVQARQISETWVMAQLYKDVCVKKPHIFVWIICSRDLSKVVADDLKRISEWIKQREYNKMHPYNSNDEFLTVSDLFLEKLQAVRPFSVLKEAIVTNGDFPSTYHFRICEF